MNNKWLAGFVVVALLGGGGGSAWAKRKKKAAAPPPPPVEATAQTARAIGDLAGKFKWGISHEEATQMVEEDIAARFQDRMKRESDPFKQDVIRKEMDDQIARMRASYVKFDGQKTGWDVSIVDREYVHRDDESMLVMWEKDQRRFLFFYENKLWKQFIAFNAEHPAFAGKTFDDFADLIQKRYGPAAITFRKLKTSDEQTLDHLEWASSGDYTLWAIDLTSFYGNYCLSLMQKSRLPEIEKSRKERNPARAAGSALVDAVTRPEQAKVDSNADIVDQITGRPSIGSTGGDTGTPAAAKKPKKASSDPLEGTSY